MIYTIVQEDNQLKNCKDITLSLNLRLWDDVSVSVVAFRKLGEEERRDGKRNRFKRTEFLRLAPFEIRESALCQRGDFSNKGVPVQVCTERQGRREKGYGKFIFRRVTTETSGGSHMYPDEMIRVHFSRNKYNDEYVDCAK